MCHCCYDTITHKGHNGGQSNIITLYCLRHGGPDCLCLTVCTCIVSGSTTWSYIKRKVILMSCHTNITHLIVAEVKKCELGERAECPVVQPGEPVGGQIHLVQPGRGLEQAPVHLLQGIAGQVERLQRRQRQGGGGHGVDGVAAEVEVAQRRERAAAEDAVVQHVKVVA